MLRSLAFVVGLSLLAPGGSSADEAADVPLWPQGAPGAAGSDAGDANHAGDIPTITVYLPPKEKATGASIVICPGGGYGLLATEHEGKEVAEWLNSLGVAGVVLKYRLAPKYKHPAPLDDARRAIRMVRWKSKEWGLDPDRVGVMGFSAGGHLASTLATHFRERESGARRRDQRLHRAARRRDPGLPGGELHGRVQPQGLGQEPAGAGRHARNS